MSLEFTDLDYGRVKVEVVEGGNVVFIAPPALIDAMEVGEAIMSPEQWVQVVDYVAREMAK